MRTDPRAFVSQAPGVDGAAACGVQARPYDAAIDIGRAPKLFRASVAAGIDGDGNIKLSSVMWTCNPSAESRARFAADRWEICVEKLYVHLQFHARDEHTSTPKILDHGVNRLRLAGSVLRPPLRGRTGEPLDRPCVPSQTPAPGTSFLAGKIQCRAGSTRESHAHFRSRPKLRR